MARKYARLWMLSLVLSTLVSALGLAQSYNATINGMITDPTGAAVPNAQLTLTSVATGAVAHAPSGPDGLYSFPNLLPGEYELKASAQGFRDVVQRGIKLNLNMVAKVDVKLELGTAVQTIEVTANASPLNFENATRQEGITPETIQELPLIVSERPRSAASFAILMPGVTTGGTANPFDSRINGGLQTGDEAVVDGVSMQQGLMSQTGMISIFQDFSYSPDMVSEVKLLTANYEPQYGSTTSSQIIANTRSGTNEYHATGYWFHRNTVLNAREFGALNKTDANGNEIPGSARGKNLQNNPGWSVGGPAKHVPLLWGGRRRTYFFVNMEAYRIAGGATRPRLTLPTSQQRQGDFSDWVDADGNLVPIYDPDTLRANPAFDSSQPVGPTNLPFLRDQFMGCDPVGNPQPNVICTSGANANQRFVAFQSMAQQWLQYLPEPNLPGISNNYLVPTAIPDVLLGHTNDWLIKGDMNWRDTDSFFVSVRYQGAAPLFNDVLPLQLAQENFTQPQYAFVNRGGWDHTFSPTLINSLRMGYLDRNEGYGAIDTRFADSLPKIPNVSNNLAPPQINFSDYATWGNATGSNAGNRTERPSKIINDLLTWVRGKHTFKFGGEVRWLGENNRDSGNGSGTFGFGGGQTGLRGIPSGNSFASFLLGAVDDASVRFHAIGSWYPRAHAEIWHVGDTWKVTPKLSLNLGVRYDRFTPSWEKYDQFSFFDPLGANPSAGGRPGRLAFAGDKWGAASFGRRHPEETWNMGFSPRLGLAYALSNKTVVRSGYGIFYTQAFYPGWGGGIALDGFISEVTRSSPDGLKPTFYLNDPLGFLADNPDGTPFSFTPPPFVDPGAQNGRGLTYRPFDANRLSYAQQYNLSIEHEFTNDFYVSMAYVGNKGTRLPSTTAPLNALNPTLLSLGNDLYNEFPDDATPIVVNGTSYVSPYSGWVDQMNATGCGATLAQALLPYPQYCDQLRGLNENAGNSTYHSFQFKAEKRFSHGTFLLASYTLSKLLTSSDQVDQGAGSLDWSGAHGVISPFERQRNKALAVDDVPQVLSIAYVYQLPFGKGKRWLSTGGVANKVFGGWETTGTFRWSSGIPLFFRSGNCNVPGQFRVACIPAIVNESSLYAQSRSSFDPGKLDSNGDPIPLFNPAAFEGGTGTFQFEYGHGPRVSNIRGFAYHNQDFALLKETSITERVKWQLRFEFFNVWNWHIFNSSGEFGFGSFDNYLDSGSFGQWNGSVTAPRVIQFGTRFSF